MGSSQIPFVFHVTVALVLSPFWSNKTNGVVLEVPLASFQFDWATTPATSVLPIAVPSPTNLIPIAAAFATVRVTLAPGPKFHRDLVSARAQAQRGGAERGAPAT